MFAFCIHSPLLHVGHCITNLCAVLQSLDFWDQKLERTQEGGLDQKITGVSWDVVAKMSGLTINGKGVPRIMMNILDKEGNLSRSSIGIAG